MQEEGRPLVDGVLIVNKPSGMTSHDVVREVRRISGEKRVGHTGTLDPAATGVLVLCLGRATRIARYLEAGEKEYAAVMKLGVTTDTLDADGRVQETRQYTPPARAEISSALARFTGTILQQPPAFSAVKRSGVPSYKLARRGMAEPLAPRTVTISAIDLTAYDDPLVSFTVRCSKGTYIRSLCADIGAALGMGAHLASLVRTRSGRFTLADAAPLEALQRETIGRRLILIDEALQEFPVVSVGDRDAERLCHGNPVVQSSLPSVPAAPVRVHGPGGRLLAVARIDASGALRPEIVFSEKMGTGQ